MLRVLTLIIAFLLYKAVPAQRILSSEEAVSLAINNQRMLKAANLNVQQQQLLVRSASDIQNPQVFAEVTPFEPFVVGVQQTLSLPPVYRNRRALQSERVRLAQLQLLGTQYDLKQDVRISFLQLQYLAEKARLLAYQDSIYQAIKTSAKRYFDAGQINKLEELQATTQADRVRNELTRAQGELDAERQIFRFYTNLRDSFLVEPLHPYLFTPAIDTIVINVQQQILQQQTLLGKKQLDVERSELLPQIQGGVSFPTTSNYERPIGGQIGITIPIWRKQNRSRIAAAKTGIELARAQQELGQQQLNAQYRQAIVIYQKEFQSLHYFNTTALPQAKAIMETSQRLFQGGELNYIESLRNLQTAFGIYFSHADTQRAYNEAVIQLYYLNGTL